MDKLEEILKENLKSIVDSDFNTQTILYIKRRERISRIIVGVLLLLISVTGLSYIPFESIVVSNIPYVNLSFVINKNYVFVIFTFTLILFFDTLFRNYILTNQLADTTK